MSDTNERSVASDGSVQPVAFAVMQPDSYVVVHTRHAAVVRREMCGGGEIVPLYRQPQPTLTDAERKAVAFYSRFDTPQNGPVVGGHAAALRGLLERMG